MLPLEHFKGITLTTWVERYGPDARGKEKADLHARTDLWMRIAQTLDEAHRQGVVHRLLRPEVVLVEDKQAPTKIRVTGFDLAKQLTARSHHLAHQRGGRPAGLRRARGGHARSAAPSRLPTSSVSGRCWPSC